MESSLPYTGNFRYLLSSTSAIGTIYPVFDWATVTGLFTSKYSAGYELSFQCVLEDFQATVNLSHSLVQSQVPNIFPEDTWAERLAKQYDQQQRFPFITLSVYLDNGDGNSWFTPKCNIQLFNYGGEYYQNILYPGLSQKTVRLMGSQEKIGVSISNKLFDADTILITGEYSYTVGVQQL